MMNKFELAQNLVRRYLLDGPALGRDIQAAARVMGVSPITLRRAREALCVVCTPGRNSHWFMPGAPLLMPESITASAPEFPPASSASTLEHPTPKNASPWHRAEALHGSPDALSRAIEARGEGGA